MKISAWSLFLVSVSLAIANDASAVIQDERCEDELYARRETDWIGITPALAKERHAWALKCKIISQALVELAENDGMVWSFTDRTGREKIAPWNRNAPCGSYVRATMCNQGCFAADQEILFGDEWLTLEKAFAANVDAFTSLAPGSSSFLLAFQSGQKIKRYTAGLEHDELVELTVEGGRHLRVTSNHAMVGGSGELFPAREARVGSSLMTVDGPRLVTSLGHAPDARRVWHISPESKDSMANIMVAQGILTGSALFQQQWADEMTRTVLRTSLERATVEAFDEE